MLQQVIPIDDQESEDAAVAVDRRSSQYVRRPAFSLPVMTNNFRRFNGRIGIVFVFQNRMIRLFTWRVPTHTLSFLAVYCFVCLDPYLLVIIPIAVVLLFIMVPAFLTRHPPPPMPASASLTTPYSIKGPALAPPRTIKPASETSKDFFRNMRDLQNSMADFATAHDALVSVVAPATNFSDEIFSSTLFLYLCALTVILFLTAQLLPWRHVFLVGGAAALCSGHPTVQRWLQKMERRAKQKVVALDAEASKSGGSSTSRTLLGISVPRSPAALRAALDAFSAISLDTAPQIREVEIFEVQHRNSTWDLQEDWEPHLFSPTPFDPLSPIRISGDRLKGTRFFEDVHPPAGWVWEGKKWELDLEAKEWVSERLITGVGYEVPLEDTVVSTEYGAWVWDLPAVDESYTDEGAPVSQKKGSQKDKSRRSNANSDRGEKIAESGQLGAWRRRRWVRLVKRIVVEIDGDGKQPPKTSTAARR